MKKLHIHIGSRNLLKAKRFYSVLFDSEPTVEKPDYLKWELDDPAINFAVSTHARSGKIDHLGIQTEDDEALDAIKSRLQSHAVTGREENGTSCCYAKSNKYWTKDPNGIVWENFHTMDTADTYRGNALSQWVKSSCGCAA